MSLADLLLGALVSESVQHAASVVVKRLLSLAASLFGTLAFWVVEFTANLFSRNLQGLFPGLWKSVYRPPTVRVS